MRGGRSAIRLLIGLAIALFSLFSYFTSQEFNPVTGEQQHVSLTTRQEIALGQQSAPRLIDELGGLEGNSSTQQRIDDIGNRLVNNSVAAQTPWEFEFHVLDAPDNVNALALPGGQIFITSGLLSRLDSNDQIAGVLAHEMVHVLARHGAQRMAQSELTNGLVGAVAVASGEAEAAQTAAVVGQLITLEYGRDEFLRRLAHPFWFQSFGAVIGMDWHSSGVTTSVLGALKRGLGPKAAEKLKAEGVTSLEDIANWSDEDIDRFDEKIAGRGRIRRDNWVGQAKELTGKG